MIRVWDNNEENPFRPEEYPENKRVIEVTEADIHDDLQDEDNIRLLPIDENGNFDEDLLREYIENNVSQSLR